ncbi:MAG: hypothetical protein WAV54_09760 [Acidimicrobiales bacterium]
MKSYAQGDIVSLPRFVYFDIPTEAGKGLSRVEQRPEALVILSQTCDVARPSKDRRFVQVAPLVRIADPVLASQYRKGASPRYAWLPASGEDGFADLDRVATITKALLARCGRVDGLVDDNERRRFARGISRKYERFPFPDDLRDSLRPLRDTIIAKEGKTGSAEGALLSQVREIRAEAEPRWDAAVVSVQLVFILAPGALATFDEPPDPSETTRTWFDAKERRPSEIAAKIQASGDPAEIAWLWEKLAAAWTRLCSPHGVIADVVGEVVCADEYSVDRYWSSSPLDLGYLSSSGQESSPESAL